MWCCWGTNWLVFGLCVHWNRSWQICDRVSCFKDKNLEKCMFSKIASQTSKLPIGTLALEFYTNKHNKNFRFSRSLTG